MMRQLRLLPYTGLALSMSWSLLMVSQPGRKIKMAPSPIPEQMYLMVSITRSRSIWVSSWFLRPSITLLVYILLASNSWMYSSFSSASSWSFLACSLLPKPPNLVLRVFAGGGK